MLVRKVFVMGMEVVSPIGVSLADHREGVRLGRSGSAPITRFDAEGFPTRFACEVKGDLSPLLKAVPAPIAAEFPCDRKIELFCAALELLYPSMANKISALRPDSVGVFVGAGMESISHEPVNDWTSIMKAGGIEKFFRYNGESPYVNRYLNPSHLGTLYAASRFTAHGVRETNLSACAASAQALGAAFKAIREGRCAAAIVGGYDSTVSPFSIAAFSLLDMISKRNDSPESASRPFDRGRDGFVPGEGAGIVVLADETTAAEWGDPLAELAGYGSSLDGYAITAPHDKGLGAILAMRRALADAGWEPGSVDYVNAHGTSTPLNDAIESLALCEVFGEALKDIAVSSTKSQIGHLIAAGGIVEFITVVAAMQDGILPPSINVAKQDRACPLSLVREPGLPKKIKRAISNSFALAGQNATIAIAAV
jgi:3-oxoacyl-[acyl-carrier-protein] synthase II